MPTLPAIVPEGEFPRSEVVAVRLARKVAPLFGVRWEHNPFNRTWVCDFGSLTLAEIARGAPLPTKHEQALADIELAANAGIPVTTARVSGSPASALSGETRAAGAGPDSGWDWAGRAVWAPGRTGVHTTLANGTLNRFGPNTKAAVVLTAANRLLDDATAAITAVCRAMNDHPVSSRVRLAVWSGLVLEVFQGQPALVVAAIQARAVQRSLTTRWGAQVALAGLGATSARCEIGAPGVGQEADPWHPVRLGLIDDTLTTLDLSPAGVVGEERLEDIAAAWCRRLLQMGRPGSGLVWVVEDDDGHRSAHSYLRVGAMVAPFVAEVLGPAVEPDALGSWPETSRFDAAAAMILRARAIAAHVAVNYVLYVQEPGTDFAVVRAQARELIAQASADTVNQLGPADPASLLLAGYHEYLQLWDLARSGAPATEPLVTAAEQLLAGSRRTLAGYHAGHLDPGSASYLLEIGGVALGTVRDQLTPHLPALNRALVRLWREALTSRGVHPDPASHLNELTGSQIFHLARYGEYLAARDTPADLRRALRIFEAVSDVRERVATNEPAALPAKHAAPRDVHQAAAQIAARLADILPPRERSARVATWEAAVRHALAVLADPSTEDLLALGETDMVAVWAARQIEPALSHLLDHDPDRCPPRSRAVAIRLLERSLAQVPPAGAPAIDPPACTRLERLHTRFITGLFPENS